MNKKMNHLDVEIIISPRKIVNDHNDTINYEYPWKIVYTLEKIKITVGYGWSASIELAATEANNRFLELIKEE